MPILSPNRICKCGMVLKYKEKCPNCSKQANKIYDKLLRSQESKKIYDSTRWRELREIRLIKDAGLCQICKQSDIYTKARVVDHIKEIKDGGDPFDIDNLQSLCYECHANKTADEAKKRNSNG